MFDVKQILGFLQESYSYLLALSVGVLLVIYNFYGYVFRTDFLSVYLLVLLTVLLCFPLFQEMDILGLKFKKDLRKTLIRANELLDRYVETIQMKEIKD